MDITLIVLPLSFVVFLIFVVIKSVDIAQSVQDSELTSSAKTIFVVFFTYLKLYINVLFQLLVLFIGILIILMFFSMIIKFVQGSKLTLFSELKYVATLFLGFFTTENNFSVHLVFIPFLLLMFIIPFSTMIFRPKMLADTEDEPDLIEASVKRYLSLIIITLFIFGTLFIIASFLSNNKITIPKKV